MATTSTDDSGSARPDGTDRPDRSDRASGSRRSAGFVAGLAAGVGLLLLAAIYLVDLLSTSGEIDRNTTVAGVEVGGLTPEQATAALAGQAMPAYAQPMTVDVHGHQTSLEPSTAGLTADVPATVQAIGERSANPFVRLTSFFGSTTVPLTVHVDDAALTSFVGGVAERTDVAPVEGEVAVDGTTIRSVTPVIGRSLDVPGAVTAISGAWSSGGPSALHGLVVPVAAHPVRANPDKVAAAAAEATGILSAPLLLTGPDTPVEFSVPAIAGAMTITPDDADGFVVVINVPGVRSQYTAAVEATQAAPVDATIAIVDGRPVVNPSVPGRTVDWTATEAAIEQGLRGSHTAPIGYVLAEPALTTDTAQGLGI